MRLDVGVQVPFLRETLVAARIRTGEGPLARVLPHMHLERARAHKSGLAGYAAVGSGYGKSEKFDLPLAGVDSVVVDQVPNGGEGLVASLTGVGTFAGVGAAVDDHVGLLGEFLAAALEVAPEPLRALCLGRGKRARYMGEHVALQSAHLRVRLPAFRTLVRLRVDVREFVSLEVGNSGEDALAAGVRTMDGHLLFIVVAMRCVRQVYMCDVMIGSG